MKMTSDLANWFKARIVEVDGRLDGYTAKGGI